MTYRVWFDRQTIPQYELVEAESTDEVYRAFKPAKRRKIVKVDLVWKTSEYLAALAAGEIERPKARRRGSFRAVSA